MNKLKQCINQDKEARNVNPNHLEEVSFDEEELKVPVMSVPLTVPTMVPPLGMPYTVSTLLMESPLPLLLSEGELLLMTMAHILTHISTPDPITLAPTCLSFHSLMILPCLPQLSHYLLQIGPLS